MENEYYKIYYSSEIIDQLNTNSIKIKQFDTCLSTNKCFAYYLKSGEVFLLPNNYSDVHSRGILFPNKRSFFDCIKKDRFPLENSKLEIEEKYGDDIQNVNQNINKVIEQMVSKFMLQNKDEVINSSTISELLLILKAKKLKEKDLFYGALILGEYVRRVNNGQWIILKRYGIYNPYYTPAIIYENKIICLFWDYLKTYFKNSSLTPEKFSSLDYIKKPGLTIESNFFLNTFYGYEILDNKL